VLARQAPPHAVPQFEAAGILLSGGSACSTGSTLPSHVLVALGVPAVFIQGSLRITLSHTNTWAEVNDRLCPALERLLLHFAHSSLSQMTK
jgi:cysteine desulfurase